MKKKIIIKRIIKTQTRKRAFTISSIPVCFNHRRKGCDWYFHIGWVRFKIKKKNEKNIREKGKTFSILNKTCFFFVVHWMIESIRFIESSIFVCTSALYVYVYMPLIASSLPFSRKISKSENVRIIDYVECETFNTLCALT